MNTPGYLPDSDSPPPVFDTPSEAWWYLYHERCEAERDVDTCANCGETLTAENWQEHDDDSDTGRELGKHARWASSGLVTPDEATGTVYGSTPGYDGDHDLGIAYSVMVAEDETD